MNNKLTSDCVRHKLSSLSIFTQQQVWEQVHVTIRWVVINKVWDPVTAEIRGDVRQNVIGQIIQSILQ